MTISGIFLYFVPPGRIAHWSHWTFLGLLKEEWQAVHTIFSLAFLIVIVFHIKLNWPVLKNIIKKKMQKGINRKRKLGWSLVLTIALYVFTLIGVPPFSTIMDWGEALSHSWGNEETEPPIPHAERMTLVELSKAMNLPLDGIVENLKRHGIEPDSNTIVVEDLASKYNLTSKDIYAKFNRQGKDINRSGGGSGRGFGRKTVEDICRESKIPLETGLQRSSKKGISATPNSRVRDLSSQINVMPVDVISIIQFEAIKQIEH
jgi:hypothetical protein